MPPNKKVWKRRDFIQAWKKHGAETKTWNEFFIAMNGDRVAYGCESYVSDAGLSIQIGKIKKALKELGFKHPDYPVKPPSQANRGPTLEEDADALGLEKI